MKKTMLYIFVLVLLLIIAQPAQACEACLDVLTLEETAAAANLIIIGRKVGDGPSTDGGEGWGGPEWIEVQVIEVLKGEVNESKITVNSWNGMCAYGIIIQDGRDYLIFLKKVESAAGDPQYDAVEWGCAVTRYPIEDGIVIKEYEEEHIPLNDLLAQLGLERQPVTPEPKPTEEKEPIKDNEENSGLPICAGLVMLLPLVGLFWVSRKLDSV